MRTTSSCRAIHSRHARQTGVTLIELLVALVIFSFGMLGLAGLQTRTLAYGQSSLYRSQATALADDILDRMRADRLKALNGDWNSALTEKSTDITNVTAVAGFDRKDWKEQVEALLPMGQASITVVKASGQVTIEIQWDDTRSGSASQKFTTVSRL